MGKDNEFAGSLEKSSVQRLMKLRDDGDLELSDDSMTFEDVMERDHGATREDISTSVEKLSVELNGEEVDIFDDVGQQLFEKGIMTKYIVDLNKQRLGEFLHPKCNWEMLQKKYGGGMYRVTCKYQDKDGKWQYFKSSTKNLMDAVSIDDEVDVREEKVIAQPPTPSVDAKEVLSIFKEVTDEKDRRYYSEIEKLNKVAKEEAEKRERLVLELTQNKNNGNDGLINLLTVLTPIISPLLNKKNDDSTEVMMKLHQMQQDQARENLRIQQENQKQQMEMMKAMIDQSQRSNTEMITTLSSSFSSALERLAEKPEAPEMNGVSWQQYMKDLGEAEDKGYQKHKDIMDLVELKASQKAGDSDGEESVASTLIKSLIPMVMQSGVMAPKVVNVAKPTLPPPPPQAVRRSLPQNSGASNVRSGAVKANPVSTHQQNSQGSHKSNQPSQAKTVSSMKIKANGLDSLLDSPLEEKNSSVAKSLESNTLNVENNKRISNAVRAGVMESISKGITDETEVINTIVSQLDKHGVNKSRLEIDFNTHHIDQMLAEFNIDDQTQREGIYELYEQIKGIVKQ